MSRQSVFLLSGLLCDARVWRDVAELIAHEHDVRSLSFEGLTSIGAMADRVIHATTKPSVIIGHSMGGRVALEVFRRAPERVHALGLLNTGVHPRADGEIASRGRLVNVGRESGMTAVAQEWLPPMLGASPERIAALWPELLAMVEQQPVESFAGQIQALLDRPEAQSVLASIDRPVFVSSATNDRWSPIDQHEAMCAQLAHPTFFKVENAGHMAPLEAPHPVGEALRLWLRGLDNP
jgi:pimeloyl-ACP methyl ester carboxylesterase